MKITIVAATGRIGRLALDRAIAEGHQVTAVVRNPQQLPAGVPHVRADLSDADPGALAAAFAGADGVLSALGPRGRADFGVVTPGTRAVIAAMQAAGARRLVIVSAAPVSTTRSPGRPNPPRRDPGDGLLVSTVLMPIIKLAFRANYQDLAQAEDLLRDSGLDWTSVRPPRLLDTPFTGHYRTAVDRNVPGLTVSRADVAHLMLQSLQRPELIGHAVGIAA